jgi:NitT/TauT family transport system ATP-binding protein
MAKVSFSNFSVAVRNGHQLLCSPFTSDWDSGGEGLTIGLMGRSGIGKTRFVKALVDLPDNETRCSGSVTFDGLSSAESRSEGKIGMAFQQPGIVPWLSVRQNIEISGRAAPDMVDNLISWLDLTDHSMKKAGVCSGGEQSRISFARSLAHRPDVLILDEPFTGVDLVTMTKILGCIEDHSVFQGKLVILITHDISEIRELADELWILSGRQNEPGQINKVAEKRVAPADWTDEVLRHKAFDALTGKSQPAP